MAVTTYTSSDPLHHRGHSPNFGEPVIQEMAHTAVTLTGATTMTAAQLATGIYEADPGGAARTVTLPTAALIAAHFIPKGIAVGSVIPLLVVNTADADETITIAVGTGITSATGNVLTVPQNERREFFLKATNITAGSEAFTLYNRSV